MLYEEDIVLHGSTIADSEGLLHGKYKSKHKSKSGKWVYVYEDAKKAVGGLFDKNVDTRYVSGSAKGNVNSDSQEKLFRKSIKEEDKKIKKMYSPKDYETKRTKAGASIAPGSNGVYTEGWHNVKKKGSIHKGYDATIRALKGLTK